jgi:type I restriction enzyme S subunit
MVESGYPVYGANGVIGYATEYTHESPTLLVGCRGTIGAINISQPRAFVTSNAMALDHLDTSEVSLGYLARFLAWRGLADITSGTSQPQLTRQNLVTIDVPLPPLDEQRRVAAILNAADALRAKRRKVIARLDTVIQLMFFDMFGDPIINTAELPLEPLKTWLDPERPITYGILKPGPNIADGVPYVRVADMQDRGIQLSGVRRTSHEIAAEYRRSTLRPGDLLMSIRGHVGRFAFVPNELAGANITQDSARLAVSNPDTAIYVRAAMESQSLQHWMARRTKGAAVKGINLGDLRELPLPVPSVNDIRRFGRLVRKVERQRTISQSNSAPLAELFASLQSRAFRGEL